MNFYRNIFLNIFCHVITTSVALSAAVAEVWTNSTLQTVPLSPLARMSDADVTPDFWRQQNIIEEALLSFDDFSFENRIPVNSQVCKDVHFGYSRLMERAKADPSTEFKYENLLHFREFFYECARMNKEKGEGNWEEVVPLPSLNADKRRELLANPSRADSIHDILTNGFNPETMQKGRYYNLISAGMLLFLMQLPPEKTNWSADSRDPDQFYSNWRHHASSGWRMDQDRWKFNYLAHPYAGMNHYLAARLSGESRFRSFVFAVFVSTFMWEFGYESIFEYPSIQDIFITPIIGSLLGELAYVWIKRIQNNDGKIMGSKAIGTLIVWALSPAYQLITHFHNDVVKPNGLDSIRWRIYHGPMSDGPLRVTPRDRPADPRVESGDAWMFQMNIPFRLFD